MLLIFNGVLWLLVAIELREGGGGVFKIIFYQYRSTPKKIKDKPHTKSKHLQPIQKNKKKLSENV